MEGAVEDLEHALVHQWGKHLEDEADDAVRQHKAGCIHADQHSHLRARDVRLVWQRWQRHQLETTHVHVHGDGAGVVRDLQAGLQVQQQQPQVEQLECGWDDTSSELPCCAGRRFADPHQYKAAIQGCNG